MTSSSDVRLRLRPLRAADDGRVVRLLVWPDVPRPEPAVEFVNGIARGLTREGTYWTVWDSPKGPRVETRFLKDGVAFLDEADAFWRGDTGTKADRRFYRTQAEALAEAWWRQAETAAKELHYWRLRYQTETVADA